MQYNRFGIVLEVCNKMVLVILEVCNQNRFGIVLEVCNKIALVQFIYIPLKQYQNDFITYLSNNTKTIVLPTSKTIPKRFYCQAFWYCFRGM
jgi:hypothetical protein